ncbi:putative UDP-glucuronosyltransferase ugt-48 [Aphelenchoides besseyi]|nr:putative UDP-glucuronosyltransferase ugt-48 [Aphelenchoides besseyi]
MRICSLIVVLVVLSNSRVWSKRRLKIAINSPAFGVSHLNFQGRLADLLVEAGHEVFVYIPNWEASERRNGTSKAQRIVRFMPKNEEYNFEKNTQLTEPFEHQDENVGAKVWENFKQFTLRQCQDQLKDPEYTESLRREKFDVGISEMYDSCAFFHFDQAKIPTLIMSSAILTPDVISLAFGLPIPRSYCTPWLLPSIRTPRLTYFDRILNILIDRMLFFQLVEHQNLIGREFAAHYNIPAKTYVEVLRRVKYVFVNMPEMLDHPRPIDYRFKSIGGIHLRSPAPYLSPELEEVYKNARDGVILFSFGSNIDMNKMAWQTKIEILNAFAQFPTYSFIWRIDGDNKTRELIAKHENVYAAAGWIDQLTILARNQTKLVLTHSGLNTVIEVGFSGKPAITIPFFNDQYQNAALLLNRGTAIHIDKSEIRTDKLADALRRILTESSFTSNAQNLSNKLRNNPTDVRETFVKFVEYATTFENNEEMNSSVDNHVYENLDIYVPFALIVSIIVYAIY